MPETSNRTLWSSLAKTASLAATYFVVGRLTLFLVIPAHYSEALWPSAGIALAGVLVLGYRVWPGVFVGSFLIVCTSLLDTADPAIVTVVALATVISAGASLQAVLGAYLVRRFVGFPVNLERLGRVAVTMLLGGPLACLTGATIATAALFQAGAVAQPALAQSWGTWFVGDSLGVMVVIPLASAWGAELHRAGRRTRLFVFVPLLIAVGVTVVSYLSGRADDSARAEGEFGRRAEMMARAVEQSVQSELEFIKSVASFFEVGGEIDRAAFRDFVSPAVGRHDDLSALSWVALVPGDEREEVEDAVSRDGIPGFRITERGADGKIVAAGERDLYTVVFYLEPVEGNEEALGFDLSSEPDRAETLAQAGDSGAMVATPPISLVAEGSQNMGFLIFAPVYKQGLPRKTLEERRRNLDSFVSAIFVGTQLVEDALRPFQREGVALTVIDTTHRESPRTLYDDRISGQRPVGVAAGLDWSTDFEIVGRRWTTTFWPTSAYTSFSLGTRVGLVLTGGLFFSSLLGAFLLVVAGRATATEHNNEQLRLEIADRLRTEVLLGASEERFRAVFENTAMGVALVGVDGRLANTNAALQKMLGYTAAELKTMSFSDLVHARDLEVDLEQYRQLLAGERTSYEMDKRFTTKSRETIWVHLVLSLMRDRDGEPLFGIGMAYDITEARRAETTVARFSRVLENSLHEIYSFDPETLRFIEVNRGGRENLGYSLEELRELTPVEIKPEFTLDSLAALLEPLRTGSQEKAEFTSVHRRKDGTTYPVEVHLQLIEEGEPAFIAMVLDITERLASEQALRYTQFTVDRAIDGISWVEEDGSFSYVNGAACEMTGYSREALLGMNVADLDPNLSRKAWPGLWRRIRRLGSLLVESRTVRRDGTSFPSEIAIVYLEVDGIGRCFASGRDTTERLNAEQDRWRLETKVQEAQKLESLGVLAGGIAHDFNNLLVGVLSNADMALAELAPDAPLQGCLQDIESSAQRAAELASQLLAYSGRGKFVVEPVDLSQLVEETSHLAAISRSKKASIEYDLARGLPALEADSTQLRQVVLNLIINASEAIGDDVGVVSVKTGQMECDARSLPDSLTTEELVEGTYVFVEVADDGVGMDEETRKKIFDPFFTTKFTGRGLGLAAVMGIVRSHKGEIEIRSEPGSGTTIKVLFPASKRSVVKQPAARQTDEEWRGVGTVLLVDDEEMVRKVGGRMLTRLGFTVLTAVDGVEAMEIYRERADEIALIVLDIAMPRMNGKETLVEIRRFRKDARVIMSSGFDEEDTTRRFDASEVAGFIHKPYRLDGLREALRSALAGTPSVDDTASEQLRGV